MTKTQLYGLLAILRFAIEVLIATVLKEHVFIRAYFGNLLIIILLFCIAKTIYDFDSLRLAVGVFAFAILFEIAQFFHVADLLGLYEGSLSQIVIGTSFCVHDLVMYAIGCIAAYALDRFIINDSFDNLEPRKQ